MRWGTLVGAAVAFVNGVAVIVLLRTLGAARASYVRTAVWTAIGAAAAPCSIGAGAWVGATAGAGGDGHFARVVQALPMAWPVATCLGLLAVAIGLLGSTVIDES